MARIKIEDLPVKEDMSEKELKGVFGGILVALRPPRRWSQRMVPPNGALVGSVPPNGALVGSVPPNGAVPPRAVPPNGARVGKRLF